jgi:hypothetical protein
MATPEQKQELKLVERKGFLKQNVDPNIAIKKREEFAVSLRKNRKEKILSKKRQVIKGLSAPPAFMAELKFDQFVQQTEPLF